MTTELQHDDAAPRVTGVVRDGSALLDVPGILSALTAIVWPFVVAKARTSTSRSAPTVSFFRTTVPASTMQVSKR